MSTDPHSPASSRSAPVSTSHPLTISSKSVFSSGTWLLPSMLGTTTGHRVRLIASALTATFLLFIVLTAVPIESKLAGVLLTFLTFFFQQMSPPIFFTIVQTKIPASRVGTASGLLNGTGNAGGILGPLGVGFTVSLTGSYSLGLMFLGVCALVGALTLVIGYRQ